MHVCLVCWPSFATSYAFICTKCKQISCKIVAEHMLRVADSVAKSDACNGMLNCITS
jgi:hypothetical protein